MPEPDTEPSDGLPEDPEKRESLKTMAAAAMGVALFTDASWWPFGDDEEYVAFVGDTPLVNRDAEDLAEEVAIYATHAVDPDDEPPELKSHRYGEALFKYGIGTPDDRRNKLTEEVRKGLITPIREDYGIDEDSLEEIRDEHPDDEVDEWFQQFLKWELLYPRGDWYEYQPKNDPWIQREAL